MENPQESCSNLGHTANGDKLAKRHIVNQSQLVAVAETALDPRTPSHSGIHPMSHRSYTPISHF